MDGTGTDNATENGAERPRGDVDPLALIQWYLIELRETVRSAVAVEREQFRLSVRSTALTGASALIAASAGLGFLLACGIAIFIAMVLALNQMLGVPLIGSLLLTGSIPIVLLLTILAWLKRRARNKTLSKMQAELKSNRTPRADAPVTAH
ncbi:MAG: hypothetical protein KDD69_15075 [Bdellovibrionales bacterium]|nr:hypothetical protein [Bdellovibrionales bacterium]